MIAPRTPVVVVTDLDHAVGERLRGRAGGARGCGSDRRSTLVTDAGQRLAGHDHLHLAEGRVHAAQRPDGRRAIEAGLPHQGERRQSRRRAEAGHAGRSGVAAISDGAVMPRIAFDARDEEVRRRAPRSTDVSFEVAPGEMFGVIGPDGAGKTTSIRMACGLLRPDGGHDSRARPRSGRPPPSRDGRCRLPVAALLAVRRPHDRREHRVLRRDSRCARVSDGARPSAGHDTAHGVSRPPRRPALWRNEAEARAGLHARARAEDPAPRRADHRRRSRIAARVLEAPLGIPVARAHDRDVDALSRRGRAVRPRRPAPRRPRCSRSIVRNTSRQPSTASCSRSSVNAARPPVDLLASLPGVGDVQPFGDRAHVRVASGRASASAAAIQASLEHRGLRGVSVRPIAASLEDVFIDLIAGTPHAGRAAGLPGHA